MIICNPSVRRILDRICWQDFGKTGDFSQLYYECEKAIAGIPSSIVTIIADRPFNWAREKAYHNKRQKSMVSFKKFDNGLVVVEEVYDAKRNQILTESKRQLIKEAIAPILDLQERWNRLKL